MGVCYNGAQEATYEYTYNAMGQVAAHIDRTNGTRYEYTYDADGRLLLSTMCDKDTGETVYLRKLSYDDKGRVTAIDRYYPTSSAHSAETTAYTYDEAGNLATLTQGGAAQRFTYTYDEYGRLAEYNTYDAASNTRLQATELEYQGQTGRVIATYIDDESGWGGEDFVYDAVGNITERCFYLYDESYYLFNYTYDEKAQLVREDVLYNDDPSHESSVTYVYTYDNAGNRTSVVKYAYTEPDQTPMAPLSTDTYTYTGNLLVSVNGVSVTYDAIGNPLSYNGAAFTWQGRRMMQYTKGNDTVSYTYNADGIRTSKTVNGIKHEYVLDGTQILCERIYSANGQYVAEELRYYYDGQGKPSAIKHLTFNSSGTETGNTLYYLGTTLAGDVCHIYDENGTVLATYIYDAWGNVTETVELVPGGTEIANLNPLRYRGYYFDTETGLYYVSSRYYDSEIGRWINADNQLSTGSDLTGMNLFAYCGNNPVNRIDPTGEAWWHWALGAAVVAVAAVATVVTCGGFAAAATAVSLVSSGVAAATTASTVAAGAFIGSATVYGMAVLSAASTSNSVQEFSDQGNWGTVAATAAGGLTGGYNGYTMSKAQTPTSTPTGKGTQNPKVKAAVQKGQAMHKQMDYGPGVLKEQTIAPGCRVDGIDFNNRIIYELKPNNPQSIARGMNQLNRYTSAASQQFGGTWTGVLKLYD